MTAKPKPAQIKPVLYLAGILFLSVSLPSQGQLPLNNINCTGTQQSTYSPGLTYEAQLVDFSVIQTMACTSLTDPEIVSAVRSTSGTVSRSCNDLLNGVTAVLDILWSTGETSQATTNVTLSYTGGQYILAGTGVITSGKFLGSPTTDEVILAGDITACSTPEGLTTLHGPAAFTVLR